MNFFRKMVSENKEVSSKRVAGIFALFNGVVLAYLSIKYDIKEWSFNGLLTFSGIALGLTTINQIFEKKPNA
jgi:ABC-type Mn2+/Zn2+ transport system permease subunit